MTETISNGAAPATRRRWVLAMVAVLLVAGGIGFGVVIASRDGSTPAQASTSAQVANMTAACTTWMTTATTTVSSGSTSWCGDMTAWMNQRVTSGQMMGSMVWGDPDRMLSSCRSWVQSGANGVPSASWCDDMVTWMRQHMNGDWNNWMMNGSMMGR